jgi:Rrf2 family transcriptional regulator, cysteine metabolism repressor
MKISQKTDYALRALYVLAQLQPSGNAVRTAEIAKREKIPVKFLEAILVELRRAGFVLSHRGAEGGHRLARPASEITVGEVWRALDGPLSPAADLADSRRKRSTGNAFQFVWDDVESATSSVVDTVTLDEIVRRAEAQRGALDFSI